METISSEETRVVRERQFFVNGDKESAVLKALCQLANERATGQLILNLNCGGVGTISFREERKLPVSAK
jgi:hypothetical protein